MTNAEIEKIIEKTVAKSAKESDERMQQYIGAIGEESKHQVAAVAEQHASLVDKIEELNKKADEGAKDREQIKAELFGVKRVLDATFEAVGNHEERITALEQKVR